ncbi:MAG: hypothetical protein ABI577_14225 [bacterium]
MNEEATTPPALNIQPVKKPDATWLRALGLMRRNPRATLLPIAVTQLPFAVLTAVVFFYLFNNQYPNAKFDSFDWLSNAPNGIRLTMVLVGAAQSLFSLVGASATMVSVAGLIKSKPVRLAEALDPAFTRMGGLLLIGALFYGFILATAIGIIVMLYFLIRFGLALQVYMIEGTSITGALGGSWRLLRGRMLSFFGLALATVPFGLALMIVTSIVLAIAVAPFGADPGRTVDLVFQSIAILVVGIMLVPIGAFLATCTTIFYFAAKDQSSG